MKLYISDSKQENKKRFLIFDELGNKKYTVSIEYTSLTIKIDIFDIYNKRVAKIRKRDILSFSTFTIACDKSLCTKNKLKIIANLLNFKDCFYICGVNWILRGEILNKNFEIINVDNSIVMHHKREKRNSKTVYEIDINEEKNEILCICISLCVDIINVKPNNENIKPLEARIKNKEI